METKQNPFSLYDFLGYFTPGALFVYGLVAILTHARSGGMPIEKVLADAWTFQRAEFYVPFVISAYTVGHVLNLLSSLTVEKYLVWSVGYPSKFLLGCPYPRYFLQPQSWRRLTMCMALLPLSASDLLLGRYVCLREVYADPLDPLLRSLITRTLSKLLADQAVERPADFRGSGQVDFFRYAYHYAVENAPNHLPKMQNYVALYGFLRTLTLIAVVFFWTTVWHARTIPWSISGPMIIIAGALTYTLFIGFAKFYRRFSLEALMALAVTYKPASEAAVACDARTRGVPHSS